ncbi:MAG: hypothetical protein ACE5JD_06075 [Candidatus Methylomirabilia bacterium]
MTELVNVQVAGVGFTERTIHTLWHSMATFLRNQYERSLTLSFGQGEAAP